MQLRPLYSRIIVFSVPVKRRRADSGLYLGHKLRGAFSEAQEAWIVATGPNVHHSFRQGQKVFVHDGFELEPTDLDYWDECKLLPSFAELARYVESVDGDVWTQMILEDSVLAYEE